MKVLVIGGGIMGTATALGLRDRGATVTLLERAVIGAEASSAAAGILGGQVEAHDEADLRAFVEARDGYADFVSNLRQRTGLSVGHRVSGVVKLALDEGGRRLTYSYDTKGERTGITTLLTALAEAGLTLKDLDTEASSLEDIFVGLVHEGAPA